MNMLGNGDRMPGQGHGQAYVIVCGNEKGGSGKTTTAMHLIVALLGRGFKVASIDLDGRQLSLTRYIENRADTLRRQGLRLAMPEHHFVAPSRGDSVTANENADLGRFQEILQQTERAFDFIVIDTPGHDSYTMRLAHSMADTLVTPINDSYVDFDVLGRVDPLTGEVTRISHYAEMVRDARRHRRNVDHGMLDWVVVRNRLSHLTNRNQKSLAASLQALAMQLGCRIADGISERVVFRELFPLGLTAMDESRPDALAAPVTLSQLSARQEVRSLLATLRLPIDEIGRQRANARRLWLDNAQRPIDGLELLSD